MNVPMASADIHGVGEGGGRLGEKRKECVYEALIYIS